MIEELNFVNDFNLLELTGRTTWTDEIGFDLNADFSSNSYMNKWVSKDMPRTFTGFTKYLHSMAFQWILHRLFTRIGCTEAGATIRSPEGFAGQQLPEVLQQTDLVHVRCWKRPALLHKGSQWSRTDQFTGRQWRSILESWAAGGAQDALRAQVPPHPSGSR